jgi:hypothetical protein
MSTATQAPHVSAVETDRRVDDYDWPRIERHLAAIGSRRTPCVRELQKEPAHRQMMRKLLQF